MSTAAVGVRSLVLKDGTRVSVRPIDPADEPRMAEFHRGLSDRSVYLRYFHLTRIEQRIRHERLSRICTIEPGHEIAIVAEHEDAIVGVGRLMRMGERPAAEVALLVSDRFQGRGLGSLLMRELFEIAKREGITTLAGDILAGNANMVALARSAGFALRSDPDDPRIVRAEIHLTAADCVNAPAPVEGAASG